MSEKDEMEPNYVHLEHREHPWRRQLSVKGRRLLPGCVVSTMRIEGWSPEETAVQFDLPLEVVLEIIDYAGKYRTLIEAEDAINAAESLLPMAYHNWDATRQRIRQATTTVEALCMAAGFEYAMLNSPDRVVHLMHGGGHRKVLRDDTRRHDLFVDLGLLNESTDNARAKETLLILAIDLGCYEAGESLAMEGLVEPREMVAIFPRALSSR